jgi:hypothetical protein
MRMGFETRIVHGYDVRGGFEGVADDGCVARGFAGAEMEGLEAAVGEPAVKGGGDGADGVLKECEAGFEVVGVEGCDAH